MSGDRCQPEMPSGGYHKSRYLRLCHSVLSGADETVQRISDPDQSPLLRYHGLWCQLCRCCDPAFRTGYHLRSDGPTAWLYGASGVNCSLFGIGERTGNTPLEAMVFEYAQLRGTLDGMDTTAITEMADYYEKEIGYHIPSRTPFVGSNFNVTRAGIHADGLLKNEEIYNIFNTQKFLNRPAMVAVSNTSGLAGIAHWINSYYRLPDEKKLTKDMPLVSMVKEWVDKQYEEGRVTVITDNELVKVIDESCKKLSIALV